MPVTDWVAFGGLLIAIISGGVTTALWIQRSIDQMRIELGERLVAVETKLEVLAPDIQVAQSTRRLNDRIKNRNL